jgi:hypothetical protein
VLGLSKVKALCLVVERKGKNFRKKLPGGPNRLTAGAEKRLFFDLPVHEKPGLAWVVLFSWGF